MATDPHADKSEYNPPLDWRPITIQGQMAAQARHQAQEADDPVPPVGGAYSRERFGR